MFKRRAAEVERMFSGANRQVVINATKPRKGSFVVSIEGVKEPIVELLGLPRPFKKLREFNLEEALKPYTKA